MERIFSRIGGCCTASLITEVSASPKPGLVDRFNSGAHRDMDFFTFLHSAEALSPYFIEMARLGASAEQLGPEALLPMRKLGMEFEQEMFRATRGVNTHKGAVFSVGLAAASAGWNASHGGDFSAETLCRGVSLLALPTLDDFQKLPSGTNGQAIHTAHGFTGVRGEAASGFQTVRDYSLPVFRELMQGGTFHENDVCLQALLHLMAFTVDTNVIARRGLEALKFVQEQAQSCLKLGGALTDAGKQALEQMDRDFIEKNISPGGCADLLAVTVLLWKLEHLTSEV